MKVFCVFLLFSIKSNYICGEASNRMAYKVKRHSPTCLGNTLPLYVQIICLTQARGLTKKTSC